MAKHDVDPVLRQLVRAINESDMGTVPVTVSAHGTILRGVLIAQRRYFAELVQRNPLMSALEPSSGLLGKEYAKETDSESDHHLHLLDERVKDGSEGTEGLWRISLEAVDGWALRHGAAAEAAADDKGPFARLLSSN
jgi:hypothetical protein